MSLRLLLLLMLCGETLAQGSSSRVAPKNSVTVQESLCVSVPCTVSSHLVSRNYYMSWIRKNVTRSHDVLVATNKLKPKLQEGIQGRFFLPRALTSNNCSLIIRDVNKRDSGTYHLQMESYFPARRSFTDKTLFLKVTALTHTPDIVIPGTLDSGHPTNVTCSVPWACEWNTPPLFSWMSTAPTSLGPKTNKLSSVLTLTPRPQDHGTNLTCQVHFPATGVTAETTIQLNVTYALQNMAIIISQGKGTALKILQTSSLPILEGKAVQLLCVADSNPPAVLSWFRGTPDLNANLISSTNILELPRVGTGEEGQFTCQAHHPLGSQSISLNLSVVHKPEPLAGRVLGAIGGTGIMTLALVFLCLCLIFRVKTCREKAAQQLQRVNNHVNPVVGTGSRVHQLQSMTDSPFTHPAPDGSSLIAKENQELHYAFLQFHRSKLQEQEGANTVYSEINTCY